MTDPLRLRPDRKRMNHPGPSASGSHADDRHGGVYGRVRLGAHGRVPLLDSAGGVRSFRGRCSTLTVWDELDIQWRGWAALGSELADDDWGMSTRLPGWSVRDLYAHVAAWPVMFERLIAAAPANQPPVWRDAAALLREFNQPDGMATSAAEAVADAARRAASTRGLSTLAEQFAQVGPRALRLGRQQPDKIVDYLGSGTVRLVDAADIGLLEAVVHRLDLNDALDRSDTPSPSALARVRDVLVRMADPIEFVEAATGRSKVQVLPVLR